MPATVTAPEKTGNIACMTLAEGGFSVIQSNPSQRAICLLLSNLVSHLSRNRVACFPRSMSVSPVALFGFFALFESSKKGDVYNILWALVFGFATINILGLVSRRIDPNRQNRMSFGEMMAVGTVAVAVILLGWEMLYLFKVLPLRLH